MEYQVSQKVQEQFEALVALPEVEKALQLAEETEEQQTRRDQLEMVVISAPTFHEEKRALDMLERMRKIGLEEVHRDQAGNAVGVLKGSGGPRILVEGHLDTVFPLETPIEPRTEGGRIYAPGIVDDTRGLAAVLAVARCLKEAGVRPAGDLVFVGTVQEEGMGGLGGMKAFLQENVDIAAAVSIDGGGAAGITFEATGFKTYEATFHGIGGHAYGAFGKVANPLHAAARAVAKIADFVVPEDPRTTFSVSNFHAGSDASIHAIVPSATIKFNFRSNSAQVLEELNDRILAALQQAAREESARWGKDEITVDWKILCDIPAGRQDSHLPIVEAAYLAAVHLGETPYFNQGGSTNSNIAIGRGVPAVCLGGGYEDIHAHMLSEFFPLENAHRGPQQALLVALMLAGVAGKLPGVLR